MRAHVLFLFDIFNYVNFMAASYLISIKHTKWKNKKKIFHVFFFYEIYLRFCSLLVLKKPSKFTVILDDNEENLTAQQDESSQESIADKRRISQEAENTVRVHFESFKFEIFSITDFNILAQSWLEKLDQPEAVAHWTRNAHCIPIILQKTEFFSLNFIYWISL